MSFNKTLSRKGVHMSQRVYISADYSEQKGDRDVVETLNRWGCDSLRKVEFVDMAAVVSGSVSKNPDCRICDLKAEFNRQINASSYVIFVVGDKTASRVAGSACPRFWKEQNESCCTPYKQNANGTKSCKVEQTSATSITDDIGEINHYSYLQHEFEQAKRCNKKIIIVYNSLNKQPTWLPSYMKEYESIAQPFWIKDNYGNKFGNYLLIKEALGYV